MAELTAAAKGLALTAIFGAGVDVRLSRDGHEIGDSGYRPQGLNITAPDSQDAMTVVRNANPLRFGPWLEDGAEIDGWAVTDANGIVLARGRFEEARQPRRGDEVVVHPGDLVLGLK